MAVSFDKLRTNATESMNELSEALSKIFEEYEDCIDEDAVEDVINTFNDAAHHVDIFNCLQSEGDDKFDSLDISIERIDSNV